jgi:hypothetical protein
MNICKVFVPFGAVGTGITDEAFARGIELKPDIISADAGSTDSGPYYLGTGKAKYARESVKNDMQMMIMAANKLSIPITIGTSGTCGVDACVNELEEICKEICNEQGISVKIAKIYTQQSSQVLKDKFLKGRVKALEAAPITDQTVFDECTNIVALAGVEPFIQALDAGADIVLCGRATDTAVIAAMPIKMGCNEAAAWHGAKTAECGCLCTTNPTGGGVFLTFDEEGFTVEATASDSACSVYSVSAHLLYENANPFHLVEPGVVIDTTQSEYIQLDNGRVYVKNTKLMRSPQYTMKLEGAGIAGYQTVTIVGIRDRDIMKNPEMWMEALSKYTEKKLAKLGFDPATYSYSLKAYGWNAVYGGQVPKGYVPNELGIMLTVTAQTQKLATQVAKVFNPLLLHFPVHVDKQLPSFAFPFSPAEIERGRIFEFKLYHVVEIDDPLELIRIEINNDDK